MTEESTPPAYWPSRRVISVNADRSGLVRVVTIETVEFDKKHKLQKTANRGELVLIF